MAAVKMFGHDKFDHFDPLTVQMGHPDAFVAMKNAIHEVRNHFAAPPFDFYEIRQIEGAHVVTDSFEIIGGPPDPGPVLHDDEIRRRQSEMDRRCSRGCRRARLFILAEPEKAVKRTRTQQRQDGNGGPCRTRQDAGHGELGAVSAGHDEIRQSPEVDRLAQDRPAWKDYYLPVVHDLPEAGTFSMTKNNTDQLRSARWFAPTTCARSAIARA